VLTALLTATYMFRLVFMAFHGERHEPDAHGAHDAHGHAGAHGHGGHLHDAPPAMALALIVLAIGSVVAGYVGVPAALGGHNEIEHYLAPSFAARGAAESPVGQGFSPAAAEGLAPAAEGGHAGEAGHPEGTLSEAALMGISIAVALGGIGIAWYFFMANPKAADSVAESAGPVHDLLLNKYYVDEIYDAAIVEPIVNVSRGGLWKIVDAEIIDGAVNGAGSFVSLGAGLLRRLQTGSVRVYAASFLLGVVTVLGYCVWRFVQTTNF
jgi:NADH-quinone oxidoreductase subunit L